MTKCDMKCLNGPNILHTFCNDLTIMLLGNLSSDGLLSIMDGTMLDTH